LKAKKLSANFILGTSNDKLLITFFSERKICQKETPKKQKRKKKTFLPQILVQTLDEEKQRMMFFITFSLFHFRFISIFLN
jgi:hypothetical protein